MHIEFKQHCTKITQLIIFHCSSAWLPSLWDPCHLLLGHSPLPHHSEEEIWAPHLPYIQSPVTHIQFFSPHPYPSHFFCFGYSPKQGYTESINELALKERACIGWPQNEEVKQEKKHLKGVSFISWILNIGINVHCICIELFTLCRYNSTHIIVILQSCSQCSSNSEYSEYFNQRIQSKNQKKIFFSR